MVQGWNRGSFTANTLTELIKEKLLDIKNEFVQTLMRLLKLATLCGVDAAIFEWNERNRCKRRDILVKVEISKAERNLLYLLKSL